MLEVRALRPRPFRGLAQLVERRKSKKSVLFYLTLQKIFCIILFQVKNLS